MFVCAFDPSVLCSFYLLTLLLSKFLHKLLLHQTTKTSFLVQLLLGMVGWFRGCSFNNLKFFFFERRTFTFLWDAAAKADKKLVVWLGYGKGSTCGHGWQYSRQNHLGADKKQTVLMALDFSPCGAPLTTSSEPNVQRKLIFWKAIFDYKNALGCLF